MPDDTEYVVGWNEGLTGPTTPNVAGPCCGGNQWQYVPIAKGNQTIAILPCQNAEDIAVTERRAAFIVGCLNARAKNPQGQYE